MATVKKYDISGEEIGVVELADHFLDVQANSQMVKDYIVALRANARQWSANTKTRAQVAHTTKKPHAQKGTGNARQGTLVAPQHRGGGRAHGPKPKFDQHVRINKRERRTAIHYLIAEKIKENRLIVVDPSSLEAPKTKVVANFLKACSITRRVLFLGETTHEESVGRDCFCLSIRNLPRAAFMPATQVSGYDLMVASNLVVTEAGLKQIIEWLS